MAFLLQECTFMTLQQGMLETISGFSCGNEDLDGFFHEDYFPYEDELMGKSYCFLHDEDKAIVGAFTVCNASIHNRLLSSGAKRLMATNVNEEKRNINYPAVLIGRLGINVKYQGLHIGSELMDFIKAWFVESGNKTGCRYLLVDAYNIPNTIGYYKRNGFNFIFNNIDSEKRYRRLENVDGELHTRLMYHDLILTKKKTI